jgi:hypothetical protein
MIGETLRSTCGYPVLNPAFDLWVLDTEECGARELLRAAAHTDDQRHSPCARVDTADQRQFARMGGYWTLKTSCSGQRSSSAL